VTFVHPVDVVQRPLTFSPASSASSDGPWLQTVVRVTVPAALASCAVSSRRRAAPLRRAAAAPDVESRKQREAAQPAEHAGESATAVVGLHDGAPETGHPQHNLGDDVEREDLHRLLLTEKDQDLEMGDDAHSHASQKGFASSALTSLKNVSRAVSKGASAAVLGAPTDKDDKKRLKKHGDEEEGGGIWESLVSFSGAIASSIKKVPGLLFVDSSERKGQKPRGNPRDGSQAVEVALPGGEFLMEAAGKAQEVAQGAAGVAQEVAQEAAGKAQEVAQEAQEVAQGAAEKAQEVAMEAFESIPGLPVAEEEGAAELQKKSSAETKTDQSDASLPKPVMKAEQNLRDVVELPPLPTNEDCPGLEKANFTVRTQVGLQDGKSKQGGAEGVDRLMCLPGGRILEIMCSSGWEVRRVDVEKGLYDIFLPNVKYAVPLGASVTIPPPHFTAFVNDVNRRSSKGHGERLIGDLVLQNGKDILTVELGFPFNKVIKVSAAGWTRAFIGWSKDNVLVECEVVIGMQVPKVPGLMQIMEFFVKAYAAESCRDIAASLALGADTLEEEEVADELEVVVVEESAEVQGQVLPAAGDAEGSAPDAAPTPASATVLPVPLAVEEVPLEGEGDTSSAASDTDIDEALEGSIEPRELPDAPGMAEANLLIDILDVKKTAKAEGGDAGLERLMQKSSLCILDCMKGGGWEVEQVKAEAFDLYLPSVRYDIGTAAVSIPSPHFNTDVDRRRPLALECDMVLQNGKDILTIKLGFPFFQTIKVTGAGWARASVCIEEDKMAIETEVHVGLDVPEIIGVKQILEYFVRQYAEESVQDIANRLAASALDSEPAPPAQDV